jgi:hypothetical protein
MPLEACSTEYFGADTITQFHHFIGFFRDVSESAGALIGTFPLSFHFSTEYFFLTLVSLPCRLAQNE